MAVAGAAAAGRVPAAVAAVRCAAPEHEARDLACVLGCHACTKRCLTGVPFTRVQVLRDQKTHFAA